MHSCKRQVASILSEEERVTYTSFALGADWPAKQCAMARLFGEIFPLRTTAPLRTVSTMCTGYWYMSASMVALRAVQHQ